MTSILAARNLGPVSAEEFAALGIRTLEQLRDMGWREAGVRWVEAYPSRLNLNAFTALIGAIDDVDWRKVDPSMKEEARRLLLRLKAKRRPGVR